jgi:AraC-like DNA-binding protein
MTEPITTASHEERWQPRNFDYLHYLQTILKSENADPLYIATELDFNKSKGIPFPYRSYFYAFGILHDGERNLRVGFRDFTLKRRSLTIVGPGILRCWLDDHWSVKTTTIFFTATLLEYLVNEHVLLNYAFFQPNAQHVLDLTEPQYQRFIEFTQLLNHHLHNQKVCAGIVCALLEYIAEIYPHFGNDNAESHSSSALTQAFFQLLYVHFREQKAVAFYAHQLGISAKHLSDVLRQMIGQSAKQVIDGYVIMEAQSLLKQTSLSVQEIVYQLGYADASHFNKLFKRKLGLTPLRYRGKNASF